MTEFFNKSSETKKRRKLRNTMPVTEIMVWSKLKGRQMLGLKFRRQYSVGSYVLDFYCPALKLAVEIDGDSHFEEGAGRRDEKRQKYIGSFGIRFLRFTNMEVSQNIEGVLEAIREAAQNPPLVPPS